MRGRGEENRKRSVESRHRQKRQTSRLCGLSVK